MRISREAERRRLRLWRAVLWRWSLVWGLGGVIGGAMLTVQAAEEDRIQPYAGNPRYWQYEGRPVMLLGGSADDNLFQLPDLRDHLDAIAAAGGNYIRNTMSARPDRGFEVQPFLKQGEGRYDLNQWNEEYWTRFEHLLEWTHARNIIVQIEVWDRFDYARDNWNDGRTGNPYNPIYNINYTLEESGLKARIESHPGRNENRFFYTVPALDDNRVVLQYQQAQVARMLEIALRYDHVLYCMDNETNGSPEWGKYWAEFIRQKAREAGTSVETTEMWDAWDLNHSMHRATFDHPELYTFIDISQNNHQKGQTHWDNAQQQRTRIAANPRPMNCVKIYGADTGHYGTDRDGLERFWRNILGGIAAARFHRPDSGLGLSRKARTHLQSARMLLGEIDLFSGSPDAESRRLLDREPNEAYLHFKPENHYAVYFPDGGAVRLDLRDSPGTFRCRWLEIGANRWHDRPEVEGKGFVPLKAPGPSHWMALLTPAPR